MVIRRTRVTALRPPHPCVADWEAAAGSSRSMFILMRNAVRKATKVR